jgi:hypothetical protein
MMAGRLSRRLLRFRLIFFVLLIVSGCGSNEPAPKVATGPPLTPPQPEPPPQPVQQEAPPAAKPEPAADSGKIPWAEGYSGLFIEGLDGGLYTPYHSVTIQRAQRALTDRGLYAGPVNGVLDPPTMKAIYAFQKATHVLQVCGVPTPRTRRMLEQGSHTDPAPPSSKPG